MLLELEVRQHTNQRPDGTFDQGTEYERRDNGKTEPRGADDPRWHRSLHVIYTANHDPIWRFFNRRQHLSSGNSIEIRYPVNVHKLALTSTSNLHQC